MYFSNVERTGENMVHGDIIQGYCAFFPCVGLLQGKNCIYVHLSFGIVLHLVGAGDVVYCPKYCGL